MKSRIKTFGTIALTAVIAFVITACFDKEVDIYQYYLEAPTGIVATKLPNNIIRLTWEEVPDAKNYEISFRTNMNSENMRLNVDTTSLTVYDHNYSSHVTSNVNTLYYYIKAHPSKTGYIASDWSDPVPVDIQ